VHGQLSLEMITSMGNSHYKSENEQLIAHLAEKLTPEQLIEQDLEDVVSRMRQYKQLATQADEVIITIICCDSRVVLPQSLVTVPDANSSHGVKKVLFVPFPTIGGGAPSRSRFKLVKDELLKWVKDPSKLKVLVTQHGDTAELSHLGLTQNNDSVRISCGLRKVFNSYLAQFLVLKSHLETWVDSQNKSLNHQTFVPDRCGLAELGALCPDIMLEVNKLHEASGPIGQRIPKRLIIRTAYRDASPNLEGNEEAVARRMRTILTESEHQDIYPYCSVYMANYDHQKKELIFNNHYSRLGDKRLLPLDFPERDETFQDPEYVVILFGQVVISYPTAVLLPSLCGIGRNVPTDNVFRTVASEPTISTFMCGLAEASYAVSHHVHPHPDDNNFRSLKRVIIVCDSQKYVDVVKAAFQDDEYREEYLPMFLLMATPIDIINLNRTNKSLNKLASLSTVNLLGQVSN